jgi:hypothetical protein
MSDGQDEIEGLPESEEIGQRKKKKRRRSKGGSRKLYFHSGTQAAIVAYQGSADFKVREKLYVEEIMPAFVKLVENLVNIHRFSNSNNTPDELKIDCVNFLFETIPKFDSNRGTNAFSYFNVVAKNWLIIRTKQKSQRAKRNVSLDDPESLTLNESRIIEEKCQEPSQETLLVNHGTAAAIVEMMYDVRSRARTENELSCINAIIMIFESIDEIDLLNKNAVFLYMRELSGLSPKQLTTTMQVIKRYYRRIKGDIDLFF